MHVERFADDLKREQTERIIRQIEAGAAANRDLAEQYRRAVAADKAFRTIILPAMVGFRRESQEEGYYCKMRINDGDMINRATLYFRPEASFKPREDCRDLHVCDLIHDREAHRMVERFYFDLDRTDAATITNRYVVDRYRRKMIDDSLRKFLRQSTSRLYQGGPSPTPDGV